MINYDYNLYIILEKQYINQHNNQNNIFPPNWYQIKDYKLKNNILIESIKNNTLIINSKLYPPT